MKGGNRLGKTWTYATRSSQQQSQTEQIIRTRTRVLLEKIKLSDYEEIPCPS